MAVDQPAWRRTLCHLYALQPTIPNLTRSSLHRWFAAFQAAVMAT
jgi:hypothetical protein